jgi:GH15 family glucan-1,4-alpha-glucosidase
MPYQPIEDYGIIGNMRTLALVGIDGSIDWLCFPHFDSPSVFCSILDDKKGGRFKIAPAATEVTRKQLYWPETNVLITRFLSPEGVGEIRDFMPLEPSTEDSRGSRLVRLVTTNRGSMAFRME